MELVDKKILMASILELYEATLESVRNHQTNIAEVQRKDLLIRSERLRNGEYAGECNPESETDND